MICQSCGYDYPGTSCPECGLHPINAARHNRWLANRRLWQLFAVLVGLDALLVLLQIVEFDDIGLIDGAWMMVVTLWPIALGAWVLRSAPNYASARSIACGLVAGFAVFAIGQRVAMSVGEWGGLLTATFVIGTSSMMAMAAGVMVVTNVRRLP